jgi:glutamate-1-semialdehyde 2,1-aminomutase
LSRPRRYHDDLLVKTGALPTTLLRRPCKLRQFADRNRIPRPAPRAPRSFNAEACDVIPAGLTHDSRTLLPYPVYAARAAGPLKWDVDGNEYVDYFGGHGALLLGHAHPAVVEAVQQQVTQGTHWGSSHETEVRWAELVQRLIPCAERGALHRLRAPRRRTLRLRLARAFTGKVEGGALRRPLPWLARSGQRPARCRISTARCRRGFRPLWSSRPFLLPADDIAAASEVLRTRDDIAAVILEASGASWGMVPLPEGFLAGLRAVTQEARRRADPRRGHHRFSLVARRRAGALRRHPDLCVLAKIVAGGLPGGAVAGAPTSWTSSTGRRQGAGREKIGTRARSTQTAVRGGSRRHALDRRARGVCATGGGDRRRHPRRDAANPERGGRAVGHLRRRLGVPHFPESEGLDIDPQTFDPLRHGFKELKAVRDANLSHRLRIAMLANGVDIMGAPGGLVSAVHGPDEVARTLDAFRTSVRWMKAEGDIAA